MTSPTRSAQEILQDQFKITSELSLLTGEYHRLLQRQGAAAFERQMREDGPAAALAEAEALEAEAREASEACDDKIRALEDRLAALGRELAALPKEGR